MAASLDGFIARKNGRVDWLETSDSPPANCHERDIALHLAEVMAYKNGMVELRYEVRAPRGESRSATRGTAR